MSWIKGFRAHQIARQTERERTKELERELLKAKYTIRLLKREDPRTLFVQRSAFYDNALEQLKEEGIHRDMVLRLIREMDYKYLKQLFPLTKWDDAEPKGKPGPVLHQFEVRVEIP